MPLNAGLEVAIGVDTETGQKFRGQGRAKGDHWASQGQSTHASKHPTNSREPRLHLGTEIFKCSGEDFKMGVLNKLSNIQAQRNDSIF